GAGRSGLLAVARGLGRAAVAGGLVAFAGLALLPGADADLLRLGLLLRRALARLDDRQLQWVVFLVALLVPLHLNGRARIHLAGLQHLVGERVLDVALDRPAQRACAHRRIPALV